MIDDRDEDWRAEQASDEMIGCALIAVVAVAVVTAAAVLLTVHLWR